MAWSASTWVATPTGSAMWRAWKRGPAAPRARGGRRAAPPGRRQVARGDAAPAPAPAAVATPRAATAPAPVASAEPAAPKRKLSYKDARELEQLPLKIETLEKDVEGLTAAMNDPAFYQRSTADMAAHTQKLGAVQAELDAAYARWEELDA